MELPLYTILLIYVIGALLFFVLSILDVYHLIRYEAFTTKSKLYLSVYLLCFIGLIVGAVLIVTPIDWLNTFTLFGNASTF